MSARRRYHPVVHAARRRRRLAFDAWLPAASTVELRTRAYPVFTSLEAAFVAGVRAEHAAHAQAMFDADFELMACRGASMPDAYFAHVAAVAARCREVPFRCRRAALEVVDDVRVCVRLVPCEGGGALVRLHRALNTGAPQVDPSRAARFVPRITVGVFDSLGQAARVRDALNRRPVDLHGVVRGLTVGVVEGGQFLEQASFPLRRAA